MNPALFSSAKEDWETPREFFERLASRRGATVVCLVPSRTDTAWWHDTVIAGGAEVRFVRGRLRFVGAEHPAPFPSAVVIFRPPSSPSQQKETNDENNNPQ